jgi:hypothetical protein
VVEWFGGVQAQDYFAAKWALALRMSTATTDAAIDNAIDDGRILRTHVLRPTWHFVSASDIHWMLELTAPRIHKTLTWGHGELGLDLTIRSRAAAVIDRALSAHGSLTRAELGEHLARAGMPAKGVNLALLAMHAELEGVVCSGPRRGRQATYALLADRVPTRRHLSRDEALAELTRRYFQSHGPATVRDFVWWSGLATADAKRGVEMICARREVIDGLTYWTAGAVRGRDVPSPAVHLLPMYDEYLVAYRDREAVPRGAALWGLLPQTITIDGQVVGTWKALRKRSHIDVAVKIGRTLTRVERRALDEAVDRYQCFSARQMSASVLS